MKLYTPAANRPEDQGPAKPGPKENAEGREGFEERQEARSRGGGSTRSGGRGLKSREVNLEEGW